jgi:hypothetical protein
VLFHKKESHIEKRNGTELRLQHFLQQLNIVAQHLQIRFICEVSGGACRDLVVLNEELLLGSLEYGNDAEPCPFGPEREAPVQASLS